MFGISNINNISELSFEEQNVQFVVIKMVKRTTNCGHSFCDVCLQEWLKSSKKCPFCMVELRTDIIKLKKYFILL